MGKTSKHFRDWLATCTADYYKWLSRDVAGEDTFGNLVKLTCAIDETLKPVTNYLNQEVVSDAQLYIDGENALAPNITSNDKFVLDGRSRYPQKIRKYRDEKGNIDFMVVFL